MSAQIDFLYTNIGRGHPFYLDGIAQALIRSGNVGIIHSQSDVMELSAGLSRFAWETAKWLYTAGSSSVVVGGLYRLIRSGNDYNRSSFGLKLLGRDITRRFADSSNPVLVAHPSLVGILKERARVIYQHGELVAPRESLVRGAMMVMVPSDKIADSFQKIGYRTESILVTGLCVEPFLARKADELYVARRERISGGEQLTGGFFSSGAEPTAHLRQLVIAAASEVTEGGKVILFARKGGRLASLARQLLTSAGLDPVMFDDTVSLPHDLPSASVILFDNRREEEAFTTQLFERFDYVVAPSHERSNWAMGMGLPMFILTPAIGPFAPLNLRLLIEQGVGVPLDNSSVSIFGQLLRRARKNDELLAMCEAGYGKHPVNGFQIAANYLTEQFGG